MLTSIMNYPNRGPWGNHKYRGNCSGHVIKALIEHYHPNKFLEIFAGGGTGYDVCKEMGITSRHLDLNSLFGNWNALKDDVPEGYNLVFSHPPYHNIIQYSGGQWGAPHHDDLSRCCTYEDFIHKLDIVNKKIYSSLPAGGRHAILIGDVRQSGVYYSLIKDMQYYGKLDSHIIKVQHNCMSSNKTYSGKVIQIAHEHLLVFSK